MNAVAAGPIYTRPEARALFDKLGATTALHRVAEPAEIAEVVASTYGASAGVNVSPPACGIYESPAL